MKADADPDSAGRRLVVTRRRVLAAGVVELVLTTTEGELPHWQPGSHVDLELTTADGGAVVRQYSLCGDPDDRRSFTIAVLREPASRGGSVLVHDAIQVGDEVVVRGPRNHFELVPAKRYLFVAGGIGITPLVPMIASATTDGIGWTLVYGGRTRTSMAYLDTLAALHRVCPGAQLRIAPQDETGLLPLADVLGEPDPDTAIYCCGPEPLLAAVEAAVSAFQWPQDALHVERFAPKPQRTEPDDDAFDVECRDSGLTVRVEPGQSILHAVENAGVTVLSSCQEGTCGTCETGVLEGVPDHRDSVLTPAEQAANDIMMICCSRARSARLVLEL